MYEEKVVSKLAFIQWREQNKKGITKHNLKNPKIYYTGKGNEILSRKTYDSLIQIKIKFTLQEQDTYYNQQGIVIVQSKAGSFRVVFIN